MSYQNLPGVFSEKLDGGLDIFTPEAAPNVVVLGTASQGDADTLVRVRRTAEAAAQFGSDGTLVRGMYEMKDTGARNLRLYRMGATAAKVAFVGDSGAAVGYTIETATRDDSAGALFAAYFDPTLNGAIGLLKVWREADGFLVYSNESGSEVDTLDVIVGGSLIGGTTTGTGFGANTADTAIALDAISALSGFSYIVYTAGTDGTDPSRMKLYENLYKAYRGLENENIDSVLPMDVYLDDVNVVDLSGTRITALGLDALGNAYPSPGAEADVLGKLHVEEYEGELYFYWDTDNDGAADLYPAVDDISGNPLDGTKTIKEVVLTAGSFTEVNFAYQLANFCYQMSVNNNECTGTIGTLPPASFGPRDVANWIGSLPTYVTRDDGTAYIAAASDNGSGLLGNKFMAGSFSHRSGDAYGGFIATDSNQLNGTELVDQNNRPVDIGKYLSVTPSYAVLTNQFTTSIYGYIASSAPSYAGFVTTLDSKSAPTNKVIPRVRLANNLSNAKLDTLAGVKYTMLASKPKGVVVSDAPTAARQDSDYQRQSTVAIVKDTIDTVRSVADPFVGEANNAQRRAALETAIDAALGNLQRNGYLQRYELSVTSTPQQQVVGDATIDLILVPAFELRQITIVLSLSAL